jgi:hypothetical protein
MVLQVFLRGGLGNQLFQYAAGIYLSRKQSSKLVFRTDLLPIVPDSIANVSRWPLQLNEFNSGGYFMSKKNQPTGGTNSFSKFLQIQRRLASLSPDTFTKLGILSAEGKHFSFEKTPYIRFLDSFCISPTPALALRDELVRQVLEIVDPTPEYIELKAKIREEAPIVIHVRLGDFRHLGHIYGNPSVPCLRQEIERVRQTNFRPVWLFSDTPQDLSRESIATLGVDRIVGPSMLARSIENLALMSMGSHLICANSTFSWWSAFLKSDPKSVSCPRIKNVAQNLFSEEMLLEGWQLFDVEK